MQDRTKALLWGALVGTVLFGPGWGTAIGARLGDAWHEQTNGSDRDDPSNDNEETRLLKCDVTEGRGSKSYHALIR
jgi:hypothetical protein